jgi:sialic acid synthase SpsE
MSSEISFNNIRIGKGLPVITIAEAAVEHMGSIEVAKAMIDAAKDSGADIIKFQMHIPDAEMIPGSIKFWGGSLDEVLAKYNLTVDNHIELINYSNDVGIQYLSTPFCSAAADILDELGVPAFKIGSGEMTNIPMLKHIAKKKKPMIISTGMSSMNEIHETVRAMKEDNVQFMLTNCTSIYPPRYDQINLGAIRKMTKEFNILVGHSDHTPDIWTALGAVCLGAVLVEKHFTINRRLKGPDHAVSLEPQEFKMMVQAIRKIEVAMGSEKKVYTEEMTVRKWAHHSVVAIQLIPAGTKITSDMVDVKRPGEGVPAKFLNKIIGNTSTKPIKKDTIISWSDVEINYE